ncbi:MAG: hypothetical protein HC875_19185 [Anaerolineales bacterium]|nr:hypothetical protein [Anaerolineales bacterium]
MKGFKLWLFSREIKIPLKGRVQESDWFVMTPVIILGLKGFHLHYNTKCVPGFLNGVKNFEEACRKHTRLFEGEGERNDKLVKRLNRFCFWLS